MPLSQSWISKRDDRCCGDACVRDSWITVWGLVVLRRTGLTDAHILETVPGLTQSDLDAAWEYAATNAPEIDRAIRNDGAGV